MFIIFKQVTGGTGVDLTHDAGANVVTIAANSDNIRDIARGNLSFTTGAFHVDIQAVQDNLQYQVLVTTLQKGINLSLTNERVDDRVGALVVGGANITATYDDAAGTLTIDADNMLQILQV